MKIIFIIWNRILLKKHRLLKQLISIGRSSRVFFSSFLMISSIFEFSDPHNTRRTANHISWYADGARKIAVSYCNLEFQSATTDSFMDSYIWDIGRHRVFFYFKDIQSNIFDFC